VCDGVLEKLVGMIDHPVDATDLAHQSRSQERDAQSWNSTRFFASFRLKPAFAADQAVLPHSFEVETLFSSAGGSKERSGSERGGEAVGAKIGSESKVKNSFAVEWRAIPSPRKWVLYIQWISVLYGSRRESSRRRSEPVEEEIEFLICSILGRERFFRRRDDEVSESIVAESPFAVQVVVEDVYE